MDMQGKAKKIEGLVELAKKAKAKGLKLGDYCEGLLIERGYVYNECFGWEKLSTLKEFNLDPSMNGIPAHQIIDDKGKKRMHPSNDWNKYRKMKRQKRLDELHAEHIYEEISD